MKTLPQEPIVETTDNCLAGGGEMGARMRALDWSQTPLGSTEAWPQSLKTSVSICLNSSFALLIWWGKDLVMLYNDAYYPIIGDKHPQALGQTGQECWPEIWHIIGPMLHGVLETGKATRSDDLFLPLERHGYPEECYFTFSYSPIRDESGGVGGVFTPVQETTEKVIGERRLRTLRDLAAQSIQSKEVEEVCRITAETLAQNPYDIPFACLYLLDDSRAEAYLVGTSGIKAGTALSSPLLRWDDLEPGSPLFSLKQVAESGQAIEINDPAAPFGPLPAGAWNRAPETLLILPVTLPGNPQPGALLVAGVSPMKALDSAYRSFFDLVAGQVAASIAEARAHEEEKRRAEALAELDRAKTTFFSNVSHEFRTPLTLMLGPIDEALANGTEALRGESLRTVHRNSLRLLKLVNTLLDFSRIEAGRVQAQFEPTDLSAYTVELASVFRSAVEKAGMRLLVDCPPLSEPVYVDREMWEKIVLNLLSNAFKFTEAGEIEVRLTAKRGSVELSVRDTGTGISEEQLPHIFERFHRIEGTRARTHEGTGIGLALVQELVHLHGGAVGVQSTYGVGTTFTISLPLGQAHLPPDLLSAPTTLSSTALRAETFVEEALRWLPEESQGEGVTADVLAAPLPATVHPEGEGRARILLADDNADMRAYVRHLLQTRYDVIAVADGEEALRAIQERRPDLILSDVMMPKMDGFGLLQTLRNNPDMANVPIILLSARAGEEARIEGLSIGADDYLTKPFSARELLARVSAHLEMARVRREAEQAIRAREAQLQTLFDQAPLGIYLVDADFRIRAANPTACAAFGDIPDLIGRDFDEVIHILWEQEHADEIVRLFRHTLETGEPYRTPEQIEERRDRGIIEYYEWQINRIPLPEGRDGVVCYFREISSQVLARQAIAESEEQRRRVAEGLRAIAARAHCLLWYAEVEEVGDPHLHWTLRVADEEAARRFLPVAMPFGHSYGRALAEARLPEDRARMAWGDEEIRAGRSYRQEFRVRDAGGNIRWLAEDVQIEEIGPNRWYAVGVCVDITERKQAEQALEERAREIEALNVRLWRSMTETHHRVKNNLQVISAMIEMQVMEHQDEKTVPLEDYKQLKAHIHTLAIVHDLLSANVKEQEDAQRVSAKAVLDKLLPMLQQTAWNKAVRYSVEDTRLTSKLCISLALVLNELVTNALKHGKNEADVVFRVEAATASLEVCDDGPGFPEDFHPLKAANLGLELVESLVRADLKGQSAYGNRPQGGGRVIVTFPLPPED